MFGFRVYLDSSSSAFILRLDAVSGLLILLSMAFPASLCLLQADRLGVKISI